jgi:hypothetical protein
MSFWDLSDGGSADKDVQKEYEVPGGNMDPIPNNSDVLAYIKAAKWSKKKDTDERYIDIQWQVEKPDEVRNRVVFQKLWVDDLDPSAKSQEKAREKRDKARKMLATIDANAKGKLMQSSGAPTDDSLALALVDARMVIKVMLWEINDSSTGDKIRGNWVSAIKPRDSETRMGDPLPPKASKPSGGGGRAG